MSQKCNLYSEGGNFNIKFAEKFDLIEKMDAIFGLSAAKWS